MIDFASINRILIDGLTFLFWANILYFTKKYLYYYSHSTKKSISFLSFRIAIARFAPISIFSCWQFSLRSYFIVSGNFEERSVV